MNKRDSAWGLNDTDWGVARDTSWGITGDSAWDVTGDVGWAVPRRDSSWR